MGTFVTIILLLTVNFSFIFSQSITVRSPNGGEIWTSGTSQNITWNSTGVLTVNIQFTINGGANWNTIQNGVPASNQNYLWTVPDLPTGQAIIRISGTSLSDQSNNYFFIKSPQFNPGTKVKILPIGNSITSDHTKNEFRFAQDKKSYRSYLWDYLRSRNYDIDFIGHKYGGYAWFPDPENNGTPGISDDQEVTLLTTGTDPISGVHVTPGPYFNTYSPDVILLHIGTNGVTDSAAIGGVKNILNIIKSYNPDIWVLLALIIDQSPPHDSVTVFNTKLQNMARQRINSGDRIIIVDMQHDAGLDYIPPGDFLDDSHPNNTGKEKIANLWLKYLELIMPSPSPVPPALPNIPDDTAYVGLPYRNDVNASGVGAPDYSIVTSPQTPEMTIYYKTGVIDWLPSAPGTVNVTVTAVNSAGSASKNYNIFVIPKPSLTNKLVSYWKFDNNSSNLFEDLPGNNDLKCTDCPSLDSGIVDKAINFNNDKVWALDDSSMYFYSGESWSFETWINTTGSGERAFIGKYGGSTSYFLGTNSSNQTKFEIRDSLGNLTSVTGPAVNDGNWHHIAGVVDRAGSKLWIYVDGIGNSVNKSFHSSGFFSYEPLQLGYYKNTNFLNGLVDETAIYNRALSQIEITEHYYKGKTFGIGYFETPLVQFGLFKDQENLVVRVKPSANFSSSNQLTNLVFTIRWLNSFNVDLGSLLSNYNIQKDGSESTRDDYEYQEFSLQSSLSLPENWIKGKEYEILNIPVVTDEHKSITFELAPQGFTPNGSGDAFVEINLPPEETNNSAPYYSSIVEIATPVELISFSAAFMNGKVMLIWITATELNNKGFNIERSFDNSNFTVIGFVDGSGSSINEKEYNFTVSDVPGGIQYYRLKQINFDGNYSYSPSIKIDGPFPVNSFLYQNFPNPFNPSTKIKYSIHGTPDFPQNAVPVTLKIYDILGREAAVLVNENQPAGEYEVLFDINKYQLSSGVYFYQLKAGDFIAEKKLVVLR